MNKLAALAALMLLQACATAPQSAAPAGYQLVWADEFDIDGLPDAARWAYDTERNAIGWHNEELQYYAAARLQNTRVENGVLILEAHNESTTPFADNGGQTYTSGKLITLGRAAWTYGFFEMRAKMPCAEGSWPAFWTLAREMDEPWPAFGEFVIMEHVSRDPGVINAAAFTGAYNIPLGTQRTGQTRVEDACTTFHRYQLHWTPDLITIGVDDQEFYQFAREPEGGHGAWPFDDDQFLILNLAVGGTLGGPVDDAALPFRMEVDYVRVYQRAP